MNCILIGYRKELNITQTEMAEEIGISLTSYYKKEKGQAEFKQNEMKKIMKVLNDQYPNLTVDEVFFYKM